MIHFFCARVVKIPTSPGSQITIKEQVETLLLKHDPEMAHFAGAMLAKYRGREQVLFDSLKRKFESKEVRAFYGVSIVISITTIIMKVDGR